MGLVSLQEEEETPEISLSLCVSLSLSLHLHIKKGHVKTQQEGSELEAKE